VSTVAKPRGTSEEVKGMCANCVRYTVYERFFYTVLYGRIRIICGTAIGVTSAVYRILIVVIRPYTVGT
jgi:hypothetical protein